MSVAELQSWLEQLKFTGDDRRGRPAARRSDRHARCNFCVKVGLDYLTLDRSADTLSGGEFQRVRLATSIGSGLVGVCYVLDEPSIGLHPRDNQRLIDSLLRSQVAGQHGAGRRARRGRDADADRLIDMGPGAGVAGGRVVAEGTPQRSDGQRAIADRSLSDGSQPYRSAPAAAPHGQDPITDAAKGGHSQSAAHRRPNSLGGAGLRYRRQRIRARARS